MSTSAVHQRVRRLEQRGVVKGYAAKLDHRALGQQITAFLSITPIDPAAPDDIPDRLREITADRGVPLGRGRRELHPQGARRDADGPGGPHRPGARRGARLDPHDGRPLDSLGVTAPPRPRGCADAGPATRHGMPRASSTVLGSAAATELTACRRARRPAPDRSEVLEPHRAAPTRPVVCGKATRPAPDRPSGHVDAEPPGADGRVLLCQATCLARRRRCTRTARGSVSSLWSRSGPFAAMMPLPTRARGEVIRQVTPASSAVGRLLVEQSRRVGAGDASRTNTGGAPRRPPATPGGDHASRGRRGASRRVRGPGARQWRSATDAAWLAPAPTSAASCTASRSVSRATTFWPDSGRV